VGTNLIVIRERRMWTQARLAKEAGVSPTTVSGIEAGRIARPHFGTLRRLANALGVDPQVLLSPEQSFSAEDAVLGRVTDGARTRDLLLCHNPPTSVSTCCRTLHSWLI
jgi:transcriptional regulator with XRE-family HTH domain